MENREKFTAPQAPQAPEVAVIGYGTAGVNAVIALRCAGYAGPIRVFSSTTIPPYSPILTSYYAGGRKTYGECFPWGADDLADLRVELMEGCPVERLDVRAHVISTPRGDFRYAKCLIATGATPNPAGFPGVEGEPDFRPFALRTMDDAERLRAALTDPACKRMLVSGASMVALKILEACLDRGKEAVLVGIMPHVLDNNALPEAAARFERNLRAKGVRLRLGQCIERVRRTAQGRLAVDFSSGEADEFDGIAVAHGMACNLGFVDEGALAVDRGIVVDRFMRTSDADVYAAGDVAQGLELVSGERRIVGIWKNAAVQGACAGRAIAAEMAGRAPAEKDAYRGAIMTNTIAVDGALFISAGTMEVGPGRTTEVREDENMTLICIYEDEPDGGRRLVGFNLASDADEEGSAVYDIGAMLTLRIEAAARKRAGR